eukprot:PhF_6_TR15955/c0_g1_i1/m.24846
MWRLGLGRFGGMCCSRMRRVFRGLELRRGGPHCTLVQPLSEMVSHPSATTTSIASILNAPASLSLRQRKALTLSRNSKRKRVWQRLLQELFPCLQKTTLRSAQR